MTSLSIVEAAGALKKVDPGRPGVADFGRRIFERQDLRDVMGGDDASTRRKRRARGRVDPAIRTSTDWSAWRDRFSAELSSAKIRGLVLDYDGTVVSTAQRLKPPRADIVAALTELADHRITIGFATGRGGSIGEMLRAQMPSRLHHEILIGYYNGAHIVPLSVDIEKQPPERDVSIAKVHAALCAQTDLFENGWRPKTGRLQITIPLDKFVSGHMGVEQVCRIVEGINAEPAATDAGARILRSGHSIDVFPGWAGKATVVNEVAKLLGDTDAPILKVGDSGDCQGNDFELLAGCLGLSVDKVCHREEACWNFLPPGVAGPEGLGRMLGALRRTAPGVLQLDVSVLFPS